METSSVVERVIVSAQITTTEHEQLLRMASVADRSLSAEIRRALRWHIEQANEQEEHGELVPIAFFRQEMCRSTLSGCVSPRFRPIASDCE